MKRTTFLMTLCLGLLTAVEAHGETWRMGKPIVTYWAGPPMTDATAKQMAEGG